MNTLKMYRRRPCMARLYDWLKVTPSIDWRTYVRLFGGSQGHRDGLAMRRPTIAAWLTAVVALSAAVRSADDPTSSSPSSSSTSKHDHRVDVTLTRRYIDRRLDELETRLGRRLVEQGKRLNHSITIHYLEKVISTNTQQTTHQQNFSLEW